MEHHDIDIYPIPKEGGARFINEPWLIDSSLEWTDGKRKEPDNQPDNIRIYIPMDLNRNAILRRLDYTIARYGSASEANEANFSYDVSQIISQIEIYDQIWRVRNFDSRRKHSAETVELVKEFVKHLQKIPDDCAELFPFETIDELTKEYLTD